MHTEKTIWRITAWQVTEYHRLVKTNDTRSIVIRIELTGDCLGFVRVDYGTNEYNFEVLSNPPDYEPTKCAECGAVIVLAEGGYSILGERHTCGRCLAKTMPQLRF
jgi:ribosomal protein S27AE